MAMTDEEIAEYEEKIRKSRLEKAVLIETKLKADREAKAKLDQTVKDSDRAMTPAEIKAYEAKVAELRKNKPPPRQDLPPITGTFGHGISKGDKS